MKQGLFLLLITLLAVSCTNSDKYIVNGHIEGADDTMIYLQRMDLNQTITIDSTKIKNGNFEFKQERLSEPTFLILKLSDKNYITLLADSIETIEVHADVKNLETSYRLKNSIGSVYIQMFNKRIRILNQELNTLVAKYQATSKDNKEERTALEKEYMDKLEAHKTFVGEFIMENPRSFAGYYSLFQTLDDNTSVLNVFDKKDQVYFSTLATSLNLYYPDSERATHLYNYVLGAKTQQQRQKFAEELMASKGAQSGYIDIEAPTVQGDTIKLSSLEGKTIIVNFWASWDEKSVASNRHLKKMYAKYNKKGLEVYSVSLDKSKVLWENAIKKEGYSWIDVSDLRYTSSQPARLYNIQQMPSNYIISRQGEIIGKNLFGSRLNEKLSEIL
ncbi:TlpA disulfide reductase family protein [Carboxylicivirga sp. M1479]|uniref:TlpA disulfide reductase family protein n=1 Tax=Carboxylicivirga sp. M1479 TaxID=2594476 RepID=UPI001178ABD8|nr:TlpA disulfide reductase family protein [Carboxylicivirga sp. M1479]TRX72694.1 AhpC/TSA family protein [Carboxylicivirga sp. M1479]